MNAVFDNYLAILIFFCFFSTFHDACPFVFLINAFAFFFMMFNFFTFQEQEPYF